jgi:hypothetical protein
MGLINLLGDIALAPPPKGETANFGDDAPSNAIVAYIVVAILVPLVLIFAGLKAYAQARLNLVTSWIECTFSPSISETDLTIVADYYFLSLIIGFSYFGLVLYRTCRASRQTNSSAN